jgi:pimeloyl-ACP methyl ester carboxylesterase
MARALPGAIAVDYGEVTGPDWYADAAARIAAPVDSEPWIAVLHSGAGGFAPALAAASDRLAGLIFVDAVLPYPGRSWRETAPALAERVAALATEGLLPRWNRWFDPDPTPRLLPDAAIRDAFVADLPRVPCAFLDAICPDQRRWEQLPVAYLQLSAGYQAEADEAARRGWPVRRAALHHLAMVSDPDKVAALLIDLSPPNA